MSGCQMYSTPDLTQEQRIREREFEGIIEHEMNFELFCESITELSKDYSPIDTILCDAPRDRWVDMYSAYRDDRPFSIGLAIASEIRAYATDRKREKYDHLAHELALNLDEERLGDRIVRRVDEYVEGIVDRRYPDRLRYQGMEGDE